MALTGSIITFAGLWSGFADGFGTLAKFSYPSDIVSDKYGTLFVADAQNFRIRTINPQSK